MGMIVVGKKMVEHEEKMTAEDFGEFLKNMRETLGFTQVAMATRLGYNKNLYNSYENGIRLPRKWQEVEKSIRELVKAHVKLQREEGSFSLLTEDVKAEILELHFENKNTVQIGTRVGVDEFDVEKYLLSIGEEPRIFMPCFSGNTSEFGVSASDMEEFDELEDLFGEVDLELGFEELDEFYGEEVVDVKLSVGDNLGNVM